MCLWPASAPEPLLAEAEAAPAAAAAPPPLHPMLHVHSLAVRMQTFNCIECSLKAQLRELVILRAWQHAVNPYLACGMRAGFLYQRAGWAPWAAQDSEPMVQGQPCHRLRTCPD